MKFEESRENGPHQLLSRLHGQWKGKARTFFQPGVLADDSDIEGEIREAIDGRFVVHEYRGELNKIAMRGVAMIGYDLNEGRFMMSWADNCHNGTTIMQLASDRMHGPNDFSVIGSYKDPSGGPDWSWRIRTAIIDADRILIAHYNIPPGGDETLAIEIAYERRE